MTHGRASHEAAEFFWFSRACFLFSFHLPESGWTSPWCDCSFDFWFWSQLLVKNCVAQLNFIFKVRIWILAMDAPPSSDDDTLSTNSYDQPRQFCEQPSQDSSNLSCAMPKKRAPVPSESDLDFSDSDDDDDIPLSALLSNSIQRKRTKTAKTAVSVVVTPPKRRPSGTASSTDKDNTVSQQ